MTLKEILELVGEHTYAENTYVGSKKIKVDVEGLISEITTLTSIDLNYVNGMDDFLKDKKEEWESEREDK